MLRHSARLFSQSHLSQWNFYRLFYYDNGLRKYGFLPVSKDDETTKKLIENKFFFPLWILIVTVNDRVRRKLQSDPYVVITLLIWYFITKNKTLFFITVHKISRYILHRKIWQILFIEIWYYIWEPQKRNIKNLIKTQSIEISFGW